MMTGSAFRFAARALLRRPGYTTASVLTLAGVVAAAMVVFSILEGVLLRPLPYPDGHRLYRVFTTSRPTSTESPAPSSDPGGDRGPVTRDLLRTWQSGLTGFEGFAGYTSMEVSWGDDRGHEQLQGAWLFAAFFETLGAEPLIGRLPTARETASNAPVVAISEELWTSRYGRDPAILGRTVRHGWGDRTATVIGVLPREFAIPSEHAQWWSPVPPDFADGRTDVRQISAIARFAPGVGPDRATEQVAASLDGLATSDPVYEGLGARLVPLRDVVVGDVRAGIVYLFWAVALVVLIAAVNLANLVVARISARRSELAVRAALGGSRGALIADILTEVALLCAAGTVIAVMAASYLVQPVVGFLSASVSGFPRLENVEVNVVVVGFAVGVSVATALVTGLIPAVVWSNRPPWEAMQSRSGRQAGRGTHRTQRGLLLLESGLSVVLLVTAGLLLRSVYHSYALDPGFDVQETAFLQFDFDGRDSGPAEFLEMGRRLENRLGSLPGVVSTARARTLPALGNVRRNLVWRPGETFEEGQSVTNVEVSPEYFRTMGIPLIEGRTFDQGDGPETEAVAIASESLVRELLGGGEVLGRSVVFSMLTRVRGGRIVAGDDGVPLRIVGVVGDVRQARLTSPPEPVLYLSMAQGPTRKHSIVMRISGDPEDVLPSVREVVQEAGHAVTVARMGTLKTALRKPLALLRVRTTLAVVLAGLAGLLTVVGIYGVVAHVVADSIHEIGVRMALGARRGAEVRRTILQALGPVSVGVVAGLAGAVLASPLVEHSLFGVEPVDPVTYGWVPVFLIVVAALAAWIPARRAAAVDPIQVLNEE